MIDPTHLGRSFGPYTVMVQREQIRRFAETLGLPERVYYDEAEARAAGLPDLPAPPTLATCYGLWANPALLAELDSLGAPLLRLLHGEQSYVYHTPVFAGDTLTGAPTIAGLARKDGRRGPFQVLTLETRWRNQRAELAITDRLVVVVLGERA